MLVRYEREAYVGKQEHYARVTFDSRLRYRPTRKWELPQQEGRWLCMDTNFAQGKSYDYSGVVLELKALHNAPAWMVDLTRQFNLVRTRNCKYSSAVWQESLFRGVPEPPEFAGDLFLY